MKLLDINQILNFDILVVKVGAVVGGIVVVVIVGTVEVAVVDPILSRTLYNKVLTKVTPKI